MDVLVAIAVLTAVALGVLWYAAKGAITIAIAEVREGKLELTHGDISPRVLADLKDVVKRPKVAHGTVRVLRRKDHASVEARGDFTDAQLQQLRNVVGTVPIAKLTNVRKKG
jgi:Protein of unknown function (DUF3634)